jgi:predicted RNase H-like HicB family nuclease
MKFLVVVEKAETGYSAYSPDLSGCAATGRTRAETERRMREAIQFHVEGLREDGEEIPEATSLTIYVEIAA